MQNLDGIFHALSDPTRRAILARLALGEANVAELMAPFALSQPTISKHLKVLESAGLIEGGRDAQRRPRRLVAATMKDAADVSASTQPCPGSRRLRSVPMFPPAICRRWYRHGTPGQLSDDFPPQAVSVPR